MHTISLFARSSPHYLQHTRPHINWQRPTQSSLMRHVYDLAFDQIILPYRTVKLSTTRTAICCSTFLSLFITLFHQRGQHLGPRWLGRDYGIWCWKSVEELHLRSPGAARSGRAINSDYVTTMMMITTMNVSLKQAQILISQNLGL